MKQVLDWLFFMFIVFSNHWSEVNMQYCPTDYTGLEKEYKTFHCLEDKCGASIENQVNQALTVAFNNLFLGAYFDQSTVQRPGLAQFFYASSTSARQHGIDVLDYLNNRSYPIQTNFKLHVEKQDPGNFSFRNGLAQLLNTEISVLNRIQSLVENCKGDLDVQEKLTLPLVQKQHSIINKIKRLLTNIDHVRGKDAPPADEELAQYLIDLKLLKSFTL